MTYRSTWPADLPSQIACVRAEAKAYGAKLLADRAASDVIQTWCGPRPVGQYMFGEMPDAHLHRLQSELSDLEYRAAVMARDAELRAQVAA